MAYRNEREDTHSPCIDTVTVGHGADQHSQLCMTMILLQRSRTETIIGMEWRGERNPTDGGGGHWRSAHTQHTRRSRENGIDRRHTFRVAADGEASGGRCGLREGRVCL